MCVCRACTCGVWLMNGESIRGEGGELGCDRRVRGAGRGALENVRQIHNARARAHARTHTCAVLIQLFPELDLRHIRLMEKEVLQLLNFQVCILNSGVW